jgi:ribosomal protein S18 acetylase RimI-like enzyme
VAFLRTGLYTPVADRWSLAKEGQGLLFGPFYEPGYEADALDLLEDAERALKDRGTTSVLAFDPVEAVGAPFHNAGWGGLSEKKSALIRLLTDNGYHIEHRELCLTRPEMDLPPAPNPASPFSFSIETRDRNKFAVKLYDGLVYAGVCIYSRLNPARSGDPRAEKIGYIDGLAVTDAYQGKGLGRLLLLQGMKKLRALGCGPVCLTTGGQNHRAQNLYYSLGFELVDSCITLSKQL